MRRRKINRFGKNSIGFFLLALLGLVLARYVPQEPETNGAPIDGGTVRVERCIDGDTIVIAGGTKIRFVGIDTPETKKPNWPVEPFGPEAAAFTKNAIEQAGNKVRLEYDGDKTDRYGRTLALVYTGETLLNEELVRNGLATAELQYRYSQKMKDRFRAAEYEAQKMRLGIWSLDDQGTKKGKKK